MKFIDFFSGVGGFTYGLELAGHKCVGHCEFDKFAEASYRSMHTITDKQRRDLQRLDKKKRQKEILKNEYLNGEWYSGDVRAVRAAEMPAADCWTFGAPCQDFSIAGKRAGLTGERSSLIREVFRLLEETKEEDKPEWLIYENVKGMLSSNRGLDFLSILTEMDRLGYDAEWQIINSRWRVPQNRERAYVIGHYRARGRFEILPVIRNGETDNCKSIVQESSNIFAVDKSRNNPRKINVANCISAREDRGISNRRAEGTAIAIDIKALSSKTRGRLIREGYTATLDHNCYQAVVTDKAVWSDKYNCYLAIRKLTPKECFRLQGWMNDYFEKAEFVNSDSQLYKQAGNGVTVDVVEAIGSRINI
ncbi:DNA cytosine methyltransferase [Mogibacterium timidum]